MPSASANGLILLGYGYTPIHTAPSPMPAAAMRMFSVAALQSCTQCSRPAELFADFTLPQTTIAEGALYLANKNLLRMCSSVSCCVMMMNSQGWLLHAVGAAIAAFSKSINVSSF